LTQGGNPQQPRKRREEETKDKRRKKRESSMPFRPPSPWLVAGVAAVIGSLTGGGTALLRATSIPLRAGSLRTDSFDQSGPRAQVDVPETQYNFGRVSVGGTGSHRFSVRNIGMAPLVLTKGATSCTCTVSDFEGGRTGDGSSQTVPPGGQTSVRIEWKGKGSGGAFRQRATIFTNDPARPEIAFEIEGDVIPSWKAVPAMIALSGLSPGESTDETFYLYTFAKDSPELKSIGISSEELDGKIRVSADVISAEDLAAEPAATGGFFVTVNLAAGLPLGKLRTDVEATFGFAEEEVVARIPLQGVVTGDLMLVGRAWDRRSKSVRLGTVSRQKGLVTKLFLTVKGDARDQVRPVLKEVVPAGLHVEIDEPSSIGGGDVVRIGLTLSISADSATANNLCTSAASAGRIVLETGHPDSPELSIPVCVAIAE
jgi:hypothetical protein